MCPVVCVLAAGWALSAQQAPPPPPATPPQQQQPVFRGEIDVIRVDVSVIDKDRRPIRGLKPEDFSVYEDGKLQRLVAVSEIDSSTNDPVPSAWMRNVPRDIAANNLGDQIGDGRVVAIVMDDWNVPFDDLDMIMNARAVGRYIVDTLAPSDVAAVIFPQHAGKTEDFTDDRRKLIAAIEKFEPPEVRLIEPRPPAPTGGGADMPYRSSPALMRSQCQRSQPTIPTLDTLASRLATIPNRRKTVFLVSTGIPLNLGASRDCPGELADIMRDVFRRAQRANINIYSVDPSGYRGYENYLQNPIRRGGRPAERVATEAGASAAAKLRRDFLEITADYTGARAVVNDNDVSAEIDQIFDEAGAYYLVGYQTSNGKPDGRFRRLEIKVNRPGASVRTRSGFYAPKEGTIADPNTKGMPTQNDLGLTGMMTPAALPLRAVVVPIAQNGRTWQPPGGRRGRAHGAVARGARHAGRDGHARSDVVRRRRQGRAADAREDSTGAHRCRWRRAPLRRPPAPHAAAGPLFDSTERHQLSHRSQRKRLRGHRGSRFHAAGDFSVGDRPRHQAARWRPQGRAGAGAADRADERARFCRQRHAAGVRPGLSGRRGADRPGDGQDPDPRRFGRQGLRGRRPPSRPMPSMPAGARRSRSRCRSRHSSTARICSASPRRSRAAPRHGAISCSGCDSDASAPESGLGLRAAVRSGGSG